MIVEEDGKPTALPPPPTHTANNTIQDYSAPFMWCSRQHWRHTLSWGCASGWYYRPISLRPYLTSSNNAFGGHQDNHVMLPSMTKIYFLLPINLDFPDRLPAKYIINDNLQQVHHHPSNNTVSRHRCWHCPFLSLSDHHCYRPFLWRPMTAASKESNAIIIIAIVADHFRRRSFE